MTDQSTIDVVNSLFERLIAINPAFRQAWPTEEEFKATKKEWVFAFMESQINSIEKLKKGLAKTRLNISPFIPSPGQFIEWCKITPEDINAPDVHSAYEEALFVDRGMRYDHKEPKWSHPCVKYAYEKSDPLFLRSESHKKTFEVFKLKYHEAIEVFSDGRIMQQIEQKKPTLEELQDLQWHVINPHIPFPERLIWVRDFVEVDK